MKFKSFLYVALITATTSSFTLADPGSAKKLINFGIYEVTGNGLLKSADGSLPKAGETVDLRLDLGGFSSLLCGAANTYCVGMYPKLYVRYKGTDSFEEIPGLPMGGVNGRGPQILLGNYDISLNIPIGADRIETYMKWQLYSWSAYGCHMDYDMTECDIVISNQPYSEVYLSNYGKNFQIPVTR